jgi:hypothetical protein
MTTFDGGVGGWVQAAQDGFICDVEVAMDLSDESWVFNKQFYGVVNRYPIDLHQILKKKDSQSQIHSMRTTIYQF